jgi:hypothetical protein
MSTTKRVLNPERLRQVPEHFSWLDHRLVREHTIEKADVCAWALYLFLVTAADAHGLSYYSDASLSRRLNLDLRRLAQARRELIALDLIAYDPPLTQVLSLPESVPVAARIERLHAIEGVCCILHLMRYVRGNFPRGWLICLWFCLDVDA